jgi:hypothetical protein
MLEEEEDRANLLTHEYVGILLGAAGQKTDPFISDIRQSKWCNGADWKRWAVGFS